MIMMIFDYNAQIAHISPKSRPETMFWISSFLLHVADLKAL